MLEYYTCNPIRQHVLLCLNIDINSKPLYAIVEVAVTGERVELEC